MPAPAKPAPIPINKASNSTPRKRTPLTLRQDNNPSQEAADEMAEKNWGPVLQGIKEAAEER